VNYSELRRFPRIEHHCRAELAVPLKSSDSESKVEVVLEDVSCLGAGVRVADGQPEMLWLGGAEADLIVTLSDRVLTLPARVAWTDGERIGLRLRMKQADADTKKAFANWVLPRTNEALRSQNAS
jgi:hypothetical protein